jgi:sialate O-acetylesterase
MSLSKLALSILFAGACIGPAVAEVHIPAIFADHMVVQRDLPVHVWGTADPGEQVRVSFRGETRAVTADHFGQWQAFLSPGVAGGPFVLNVEGVNKIAFSDIYAGDVWIASGQSNMEFRMHEVANAEAELKNSNRPLIRVFQVEKSAADYPMNEIAAKPWALATSESVADFSAVAFLFAREIQADQKVAIGVIEADWGGTPAEAWTSLPALTSDASLMPVFAAYAKLAGAEADYAIEKRFQDEQIAKAKAAGTTVPSYPFHPILRSWIPASLFNGMIAPLTSFPIRGVIWYQGESNAGDERGPSYNRLFEALIRDWRSQWKIGDFPFLFVQLANWKTNPNSMWPVVRDAQRHALELKNTGMAVAIDIGNPDNIHPTNKQDVAHRLALAAEATVYGKAVEYSGPLFKTTAVEGSALRVSFSHTAGLKAKGNGLTGFEIAGADRKFVAATARIDHDSVLVSVPSIASPVYARYGWDSSPECNLYNEAGLPASPFTSEQ